MNYWLAMLNANKIKSKSNAFEKKDVTIGLNQLTKIIQLIGLLIHINKYQPRVFKKKLATVWYQKQQNRLKPLTNEEKYVFLRQIVNNSN